MPVAWPAYTCVQPAHHLRQTCEHVRTKNTFARHLRSTCGISLWFCNTVSQKSYWVCDLGVLPFSTDSCCSGGMFLPTMEISRSLERKIHLSWIWRLSKDPLYNTYYLFRYAIYLWLFGISRLRAGFIFEPNPCHGQSDRDFKVQRFLHPNFKSKCSEW